MMRKATVCEKLVTIPTYAAGMMEKNPMFLEKRAYQGSTGKVYPLPICETVSGTKEDRTYRAVILENDYLYVMVLPELGGRIQRALDKTNNYDFVYYNRVIKPALVGLTGPWISGGIEFNWPQHHRPSTFSPVDYRYQENADGSATVVLGETDRMYGTKGNAAITLYPDKAYIEIRGQLFNPTDYPQTFLWWANPAVAVNEQTFSVFPPDVNAVMDHGKRAVSTFPIATGEYYKADYSAGVDISRYKNIRVPTSYMAAHSDFDFVGNFDEGRDAGLLHVADHHVSPGKKQWTWGCGDFGKTWDRNLTDEDGPYIELMTGVYCDNQPDFTWLKPHEEKNFVQYFMPYKTVGRVSNATRDVILGVDMLDVDGKVLDAAPFASEKPVQGVKSRIKVYASGEYPGAQVIVYRGGREVYRKTVDLSPRAAFTDELDALHDYTIRVTAADGKTLCAYKEYIKQVQPIPEPAEALKKPEDILSLEELYLAGQHLEQYRHATFEPADYYREGLRRDPTDIRLNDAYGLYLLRHAQVKESVPYFQAAIKKQTWRNPNPYSGEVYAHLGLAYELLNETEKAYNVWYKATWSGETAGNAYFHLACLGVKQGYREEALRFAWESLHRGWHDMKVRSLIALLLTQGEDKQETQRFLAESQAIDPLCFGILYFSETPERFAQLMDGRLENYLNLAYDWISFGCYEEAVALLKACPVESPLKHDALAYAELLLGDPEAVTEAQRGEACAADGCFPNQLAEWKILTRVIDLREAQGQSAARAHYYLGELLYDKKQYTAAIAHWQAAAAQEPGMAPAHRNLSIAYYNHGDRSLAAEEIAKACAQEPDNSRFLLEQDQLLSRLERPVQERLALLEAHAALLPERYALMLAYVNLLNADGQYEKALNLLTHYTFHVWEGGEGKVAQAYKDALLALAEKALEAGKPEQAVDFAVRTLTYPENLGEGKLDNVPDHHAHYLMGCAYREMGQEAAAREYFAKATQGSSTPEVSRYYNDQPSDYIYYQGLAFRALGEDEKAKKSFHQLIIFGERHIFDKVEDDFFAVSLPELEVYQTDTQKKHDKYCCRLMELGQKGLEQMKK